MNDSIEKINSQIHYHLSYYLQKHYPETICSVVDVDTYTDLSTSNVMISELNDNISFVDRLNRDSKSIRYSLAKKLSLRKMPSLHFELDKSDSNYRKISELLNN